MLTTIVIFFLLAILCPFICRWHFKHLSWLLAIVPAACFYYFFRQIPHILHSAPVLVSYPWLSAAGVKLSFYLDGLSLLFALLITGIGTVIVLYSQPYLGKHPHLGRYYCYLFLFTGSMLGTVLAENLMALFVFWELTSITSYLLISFDHKNASARSAALQGLLVTAGGGLAMFTGFILIGNLSDHFSITALFSDHSLIVHSGFYFAIILLVLIGAFTKSAQFPFHFWLPNAMRAPTPVSAFLHSATMVKLGVYLVARMTPILGHTPDWVAIITVITSITMLCAAVLAIRASDLKLILAYSTIMALAALMFLLSSGKPIALEAAMVFLVAHALYKAALFLCAGIIDHATGTRDIDKIRGLSKFMPITFIAVLLAAASMAGLPPVLGFISKEMFYASKLTEPNVWLLLTIIAFITNMVFVLIALLFAVKLFFGKDKRPDNAKPIKETKFTLWIGPLVLGILGMLFGLYPSLLDQHIISPSVSAMMQESVTRVIKLWHGVTPELLLSLCTFIAGFVLYKVYRFLHHWLVRASWIRLVSPEAFYFQLLRFLRFIARINCQNMLSGYLRIYTAIVFAVMAVLTIATFIHFKHVMPKTIIPDAPWFAWIIAALMIISGFAVIVTTRHYLASLTFLGVIGLCSTMIFLLYSAPDVAMTQLLVDVLTIVIVVIALYRLPTMPKYQRIKPRIAITNGLIALAVGGIITAILLSVVSLPFSLFVNNFYSAHSFTLAHGRNIVNVILVDFRAYDTLGEVIVVCIAGLGVYGLLKTPQKMQEHENE